MKRTGFLLPFAALALASPAQAYFGAPGKQTLVLKSMNSSPYGYSEYLPADYADTGTKRFPLVIFLHGLGEQGNGESQLSSVTVHGPSKLIKNGRAFPGVVVSPQSPTWWNSGTLNTFLTYLLSAYPTIDPNRVYVTGLSMGGGGTWDFATAQPGRIAAIVPICGAAGGSAARAALYGMPTWAFHAFNDGTVGLGNSTSNIDSITPTSTPIMSGYPYGANNTAASTDMIALYSRAGDRHQWYTGGTTADQSADTMIRFTVYPSGGHDSWTRAYNNNDMWNWLFLQKKSGVVPTPSPTPSPTPTPTPTPPPTAPISFDSGNVTIDFGGAKSPATNVVADAVRGTSVDLVDGTGKRTTADVSVVKGFNAVNANGTTSPAASTGFTAAAARDSFFGNDVVFGGATAPTAQLEIAGLNPAKAYTFRFFASRIGAGGDNRETLYAATGTNSGSATLNAAENTAGVAEVAGIRPSATGKIVVDVRKGARNTNSYGFFYLGAMKITASTPTTPAPSPTQTPTPTPTPTPPAATLDVRVDFGASATVPAGWNSGQGLAKAGSSLALKTATGAAAGTLAVTAGFNAVNPDGTQTPASALGLPAVASRDSFFGNDVSFAGAVAPKARLEIRGLDPAKSYRLEFFASRMGATENRETLYKVTGAAAVSATLDPANNTSAIARTAAVKPNAAGTLVIEVSKGPANRNPYGFYYLGSLRLRDGS